MAALNALLATAGLEFARLKKLTGATDGNLGAHIETLAKAGYVSVEKECNVLKGWTAGQKIFHPAICINAVIEVKSPYSMTLGD